MLFDPSITTSEMAQKTGIKFRTLQRHISLLQAMGVLSEKMVEKMVIGRSQKANSLLILCPQSSQIHSTTTI